MPGAVHDERDLARRVRVTLAELDMPHKEFARLAGLSRPYLSSVLHGKAQPGELAQIKLERTLAMLNEQRKEVIA